MNQVTKKTIIGLAIAAGLLCIVIVGALSSTGRECDMACKYGTEAVEVLKKYKASDISSTETNNRITKLAKEVAKEKDNAISGEEYSHRLTMLWLELISIETKFAFSNNVPFYEIDESITEINQYIGGKK